MHAVRSSHALEFVTRCYMRMLQDSQVGQSIKNLSFFLNSILFIICIHYLFFYFFLFLLLFHAFFYHSAQFNEEDHQHVEQIPLSGRYFCIFCLTGDVSCHRLFIFCSVILGSIRSLPC